MPRTPATTALHTAGIAFTEHEYRHDPANRQFGREAAEALGLEPASVFKTIVVLADAEPVVAIVPVHCEVDLKALARACGAKRCELMTAPRAERLTGYVVGGISPLGQRQSLRTFIDQSCLGMTTMYVSGGRRGFDIGLAPEDLVRALSAQVCDLASSA